MALVGARRSWLAVVAVLGLVGSLLAVGVVPAAAKDGTADNEAVYSACVGPALESLGLVDVVGSFAEDAVNCLGHYGITRGRTATTYDPGAPVLRWQMALFLTRAAGPAGVQLLAVPDDVFTDLGDASDETRSAINQMSALGIMPGRSGERFSPDTAVSRASMAEMLDAFLGKARPGVGAFGGLANVDELSDVSPDDTVFGDIEGVARGQYSAIRRMFELGVTRGTSDNQFSPGGLVTRAQMAAFITRMLAHTVARPAGLTMQASALSVAGTAASPEDVDLVVSVRDSAHMAMPDESVDVFSAENAGDAFGSDGRCSNDEVSRLGDGTGVCEIEVSDGQTNSDGDVEITGQFGASATVWAWAGDVGDRFDADDTVSASLEITVTKPATKLRITDDMAVNATAAKFGDRVTFVIQVVDDDGNPVATKDVSVSVSAMTWVDDGASDADPSGSGASGSHKTDDSGRIELSYRQADPRTSGSDHGGDKAWLDLDITYSGTDLMLEDKTTLKKAVEADGAAEGDAAVLWLDTTAKAKTLTLAQAVSFHEASGTGSGASNTVTATLVDQYGDPVSRQKVEFTSDDVDGIGAEAGDEEGAPAALVFDIAGSSETRLFEDADALLTRTTNRRGVASLTYNRDSADSGIETILASVTVGSGDSAETIEAERAYHYWAEEPGVGETAQGRLVASDTDNNQLVLAGAGVSLVKYDSNDHFTTSDGASTLSAFETDLRDNAKHASVSNYQTASKNVSLFTTGGAWTRFGYAETASGRTNADGVPVAYGESLAADGGTVVAGAPWEAVDHDDDDETADLIKAGKVYVFDGVDTSANPEPQVLQAPMAAAADNGFFGEMVELAGNTLVVGAPACWSWAACGKPAHDRTNTTGNVFIYTRDSAAAAFTLDATLTNPSNAHRLGSGVGISADEETVAAYQPYGKVLVYQKPSGGWADASTPTATLTDGSTSTLGSGGKSIALSRDGSVLVGEAFSHDQATPALRDIGRAVVFERGGAAWANASTATAILSAPTPMLLQRVGKYVAVSGDGDVIAISGHFRVNQGRPGEVYVFTKPATGWETSTEPAVLKAEGGRKSDNLGQYLDIDDAGTLVAASRHHRQEGDWRGSVVVYRKPATGWESTSTVDEEYLGAAPGDRLGWQASFDRSDSTYIYAGLRKGPDVWNSDVDLRTYPEMTVFRIERIK